MNNELAAFLILVIPFGGALLVPFINLFAPKAVPGFAVLSGLVAAAIAFFIPFGMQEGVSFTITWLPGVLTTGFVLDPLSSTPALIAIWIGFLVLVYSLGYMKHEKNLAFYYSTVLMFIGAMAGMAMADNFLTLFFFWEVMGVCSYLLIGFFFLDPKAANAGMKAFITTKIGDVGLLAAILILYSQTGTFSIQGNIAEAAQIALPVLSLVSFGFILGAMGKSAQLPLHVWLPDAMEAPTTISALIHAATMVNAGVYLLARVFPIIHLVPSAQETVLWMGVLTAFLGSFLATFNNDLKRILAYSTVSQLGYMITAIGLGAIFASQFHLFSHAIFKALLFLCAGSVIHSVSTRDIREMGKLRKFMPITAFTFTIGALALMGLPLLNGFFSKDLILESAMEHHAFAPLVIAVLAAMLTVFYSIRTTYKVFWAEPVKEIHAHESPSSMTIPLMLLAIGTVFSWILVGNLSTAWNKMDGQVLIIDWIHLLTETFTSAAFVFTLVSLLVGYLLFRTRKKIKASLDKNNQGFMNAVAIGLGFDKFYMWVIGGIIRFGEFIRNIWEQKVMEGINQVVGGGSIALGRLSAKLQTGDLHWNILYIIVALLVIIGALLW